MPRVLDEGQALVTVTTKLAGHELVGELPCWEQPIEMDRTNGISQAQLRVAPGIYQMKLRDTSGRWSIDPTWRRWGDNAALVVGGTDEPVLHAPAYPWLVVHDDGHVTIRAALRRGAAGDRLSVRLDESAGRTRPATSTAAPSTAATSTSPTSTRPTSTSATSTGPTSTGATSTGPTSTGSTRDESWVRHNLYNLPDWQVVQVVSDPALPMRLVGADATHLWFEVELPGASRSLAYSFVLADGRVVDGPTGPMRAKLRDHHHPLPAWWRDAVVYTIFVDRFRRRDGVWPTTDWERDVRAGGDLDGITDALPYLEELGVNTLHLTPICEAHSPHRYDAIDPRCVADELGGEAAFERLIEAAHARGMRIIVDVAATHVHRDFAPFRDVRERGPESPYWPWFQIRTWPFSEGQEPGYLHYQKGQWEEPLLAVDEPEVQEAIVSWFAAWAKRGVDGVRVDAAADLPRPLLAKIRRAVRAANPQAIVFGEIVPQCIDRFAPSAIDAATDFAFREALVGWVRGEQRLVEVARAQRWRGAAGLHALGFTSTHDQPRIGTVTQDRELARRALAIVMLGARVPMLYYGDEVGLAADPSAAKREFEDAWPDRQPMPWERTADPFVRDLLALRRAHAVLREGDEEISEVDANTLRIRRRKLHDVIDVLVARTGEPEADGSVLYRGHGVVVIDRREPIEIELRAHNAAIAAQAFVDGHVECPAYPTRLYLTVTESCNLRCAHCITDAPVKTQAGTARTIQPWLLDALHESFAHAEYVAFTHGGESVTAPIFPEVLRRIRRARDGQRTDVHLVSNGMLLDDERIAELVELGLTSLMISLDGATPQTNDKIRVLGKLDRVVANLRAAVKLRERGLRVGVSTVVGATNVHELVALGRLCVDLGVDWLKVEETYPATPFARADLLAPNAPDVQRAMAALRDVCAQRLVLVDHLAPPAGCACSRAAAAIAFREADDFANRAAFRPCRMAWEQAAIDPDGTVHVVDYAGAPLGNLLDASMLALWNAGPAIAARSAALAASTAERRRACVTRTAAR